MKLQAKFTLNFILLVLVTVVVSFWVIHWNVENQFDHFIDAKKQQWVEFQVGANGDPKIVSISTLKANPFTKGFRLRPGDINTPEDDFLKATSSSLVLAAVIVTMFAVIFGYFSSKFLLARLQKLKSSMSNYMEKGIHTEIEHGGDDEVDELSEGYNQLISKLEKQEKIRKDFFVDMSHELRTPLTSIKGYLEGLNDGVFAVEKTAEIYGKALKETDRMIRLVKESTDLAKLEAEAQLSAVDQVDLRELTAEVVEMIGEKAANKKMSFEVIGQAKIHLDEQKFKQVLINLVDNAVVYGLEGSTVKIQMKTKENLVNWKIVNSVENVDQIDTDHLFERFYRADQSRVVNDVNEGHHLGIGLNIVQKIVKLHGGKVEVYKENGQIVFEIILKAQDQDVK